jgi:hypothetical protein
MRRRHRGFSLIELAVVLVGAGLMLGVVWQLRPLWESRGAQPGPDQGALIADARESLAGFALTHAQLPCADADGNGRGDCDSGGEGLPWRDLGIREPSHPIRYVPAASLTSEPGDEAYQPAGVDDNQQNGLDLCANLLQAGSSGSGVPVGSSAQTVASAFVLAAPGADRTFQGNNRAAGFDLPGRRRASSDDIVVAQGLRGLAARLGCPERLARARTAAASAQATASLERVAALNRDFREVAFNIQQMNLEDVRASLVHATTLAAVTSLLYVVEAVTIAQGSPEPLTASALLGIAGETAVLGSVLGRIMAELGVAADRLNTRDDQFGNARDNRRNARDFYDRVAAEAERQRKRAEEADKRGLLP